MTNFIKLSDYEDDITDAYNESCDPENENGHVVTAYYANEGDDEELRLTGVFIEDDVSPVVRERGEAIRLLGSEIVRRVEKVAFQTRLDGGQ